MRTKIRLLLKNKINWAKYPSIKTCPTNKEKAYLVLHIMAEEFGVVGLSASELAYLLSKKFRKTTSPQAIRTALTPQIGETVEIHEIMGGIISYSLLPKALQILGVGKALVPKEFVAQDIIIPFELVEEAKNYLKKVVFQINGCYRDGYYDACYVMVRRFFETLIIEIYETKKSNKKIQDVEGNYLPLSKLIGVIINDKKITPSKHTKAHLSKIKLFGDAGAHARKIILKKIDLDRYRDEIRLCAEDLLGL